MASENRKQRWAKKQTEKSRISEEYKRQRRLEKVARIIYDHDIDVGPDYAEIDKPLY